MRRECWERLPGHRLQRKPLVNHPSMHHMRHARAVMHVGVANQWWRENVPGIPGACATRNFIYLARGPWKGFCHPYYYTVTNSFGVCCLKCRALICTYETWNSVIIFFTQRFAKPAKWVLITHPIATSTTVVCKLSLKSGPGCVITSHRNYGCNHLSISQSYFMMTSSNGNIFRVTGP